MKKVIVLILGLSLTAASCNVVDLVLGTGGGTRGVFRSEDNGETFHAANLVGKKGNINNLSVTSLAFDPSNPETLYLGSQGGMYKSEDAAQSWTFILSGIAVADVAVDPFQSSVVYAAGLAAGNGKIIKSLDGGVSWVDIYTEPSKNDTVTSLTISRSNSSIILAGLTGGEIIRSSDGGRTWQGVKDLSNKLMRVRFGPSGAAYALAATQGLFKSTDLGLTWTQMTNTLTNTLINPVARSISSVSAFYDIGLDKKQGGVLYLGTEQGLFRSINDGASWSFVTIPVKNTSLRVSSITVDPNNSNNLFVGIDSIIFKSVNGGVTWQTKVLPAGSEIRAIQINPQASNVIYAGLGSPRSSQ